MIILQQEDWLFSNQEVGTSPFLICDFTLLLNTAGSCQVQSAHLETGMSQQLGAQGPFLFGE